MSKSQITIIIAIILIAVIGIGYIVYTENNSSKVEAKVGATIFPIYDIATNIAGEKIEVVLIAPPGASPHTFEPTPVEIKNLQGSQIIFSIGHGLDEWTHEITDAIPGSTIIPVSNNISLIQNEEEENYEDEHEGEHHHGETNPHYWLSVPNAKIIAKNITDELVNLDPKNKEYYENNLAEYESELDETDSTVRLLLRNTPNRNMITMHDAWPYFTNEYGLEIVATFEPSPGQEPTAKYLADLAETAEEYEIKTIFSEPQLANQTLFPFIQDYGLDLEVLDPIGGTDDRRSYIETTLYNAKKINDSLQ